MLPVVTRTVAKSINIEKTVGGGDKERALVYRKMIPFWVGGFPRCCPSSLLIAAFIYTKAGEIDSPWFILSNWTC